MKSFVTRSVFVVILVAAWQLLRAQVAPPSTAAQMSACPLPGWAEGMVRYVAPQFAFPTTDTAGNPTSDCVFHEWSWEAFVWATAMVPVGNNFSPRFLTLHNLDELDQPERFKAAKDEPKPLVLKPRTVKTRGSEQDIGEFQQAGSEGILVDQSGQALFYSQHANDLYFDLVQKYYGVSNYQKASPTLEFPVGAAVFKASWRIVPGNETIATNSYTTQAIVPLLVNNPKGGIMIDPSGKTRQVTVALVGLHVVGVTVNHPEFLWATFEQLQNAPDLAAGTTPSQPVSNQSFTFYKAGTPMQACNVFSPETMDDQGAQTLKPITNVYRQFSHGGENTAGAQEIDNINTQAQGAVKSFQKVPPGEAIWANYKLIGTVWIQANTLQPGDGTLETQALGSVNLADATMETFVQGAGVSCFSCHNTSGNSGHKIAGKDINLSHKLLEPLFNNPAVERTPHRLSALEAEQK